MHSAAFRKTARGRCVRVDAVVSAEQSDDLGLHLATLARGATLPGIAARAINIHVLPDCA